MTSGMFMVEVYGKMARQINALDPAHRRTAAQVCKEAMERREEKKGRKKLPVPGRGIEPTTLTLTGKAPFCNIYTAQKSLPPVALLIP